MLSVNNRKTIFRLSKAHFKSNRQRNIIALLAIALTSILFTSIFTMGFGTIETLEMAFKRMSGGDGHVAIKYITPSQYQQITSHPSVSESAYCQLLANDFANPELLKRHTEFWYYDEKGLDFSFIELIAGHFPVAADEVIVDSETLKLLNISPELGQPIVLDLKIRDQAVKREFKLAGWWQSDPHFNVGQIFASKAYVVAHKDELVADYAQSGNMVGSIVAYVKFDNSLQLEEKLQTLLAASGYSSNPEAPNYLATGINWSYMSSNYSLDFSTLLALALALTIFILTGYLIIYNIFYISVLRDVAFYGLLKTIGTTQKQLKRLVHLQGLMLSAIGIPIGLGVGYIIGKALVPFLIAQSSYSGVPVHTSPNPKIFLFAGLFALLTVRLSTWKPSRLAGKISPLEALGYNDSVSSPLKDSYKKSQPFNAFTMARNHLRRQKKKTRLVILSLSLSILLTNTVLTLSQSIDVDKALDKFSDSDFLIAHAQYFNHAYRGMDESLSKSFQDKVKSLPGFEAGGALYNQFGFYESEHSKQQMNRQSDGSFLTEIYGLDAFPFSQLKLIDGSLNAQELSAGNLILEGVTLDDYGQVNEATLNHQIGDTITLNIGKQSHTMTIVGHVVANPSTNMANGWGGSAFYLPSEVFFKLTDVDFPMSYAFNMAEAYEQDTESFLADYTERIESQMSYTSKFKAQSALIELRSTAVLIGGSLAFIIGIIGLLNFVNAVFTSLVTRQKELAIMESIGMTQKQLIHMLSVEGGLYALVTSIVASLLSVASSLLLVKPLCSELWFTQYKFLYLPLLVMIPCMLLLSYMIPRCIYYCSKRETVVERLRHA